MDGDEKKPTELGKTIHEPDGYYYMDDDYRLPCTCTELCGPLCKGSCGCEACSAAYNDFLSLE